MNPVLLVLGGWLFMALVMIVLWEVQRRSRNAGIVDVVWTAGVGILGVLFAFMADGYAPRRFLIAGMIALWALRLGGHLYRRVTGETEDGRYRQVRQQWGERTQLFLFFFFQLQAFWSVLFAFPLLIAARNASPALGWKDVLGILIWLIAIAGEGIADRQLARFRTNPQNHGKVCAEGLWRYSRHPNYFFEWVHWWAYVVIGIAAPQGWLTLLGPIMMLGFLFKITGIPPTEAQALRTRGEAYREYQRTTSVFFPLPPRKRKAPK